MNDHVIFSSGPKLHKQMAHPFGTCRRRLFWASFESTAVFPARGIETISSVSSATLSTTLVTSPSSSELLSESFLVVDIAVLVIIGGFSTSGDVSGLSWIPLLLPNFRSTLEMSSLHRV